MSVTDLVGPARGDVAGLSALAARLRRAADALADPRTGEAVRAAAEAVGAAAAALRQLPAPPPPGAVTAVEGALATALAPLLAVLTREGNHRP